MDSLFSLNDMSIFWLLLLFLYTVMMLCKFELQHVSCRYLTEYCLEHLLSAVGHMYPKLAEFSIMYLSQHWKYL